MQRINYGTWHFCGGNQNEAASLQKACKDISKRKKEKACRGNWSLSDLMGGDVAAIAGLCVVYGRVRHSTVGPATKQSKVQVEKERKNLRVGLRAVRQDVGGRVYRVHVSKWGVVEQCGCEQRLEALRVLCSPMTLWPHRGWATWVQWGRYTSWCCGGVKPPLQRGGTLRSLEVEE